MGQENSNIQHSGQVALSHFTSRARCGITLALSGLPHVSSPPKIHAIYLKFWRSCRDAMLIRHITVLSWLWTEECCVVSWDGWGGQHGLRTAHLTSPRDFSVSYILRRGQTHNRRLVGVLNNRPTARFDLFFLYFLQPRFFSFCCFVLSLLPKTSRLHRH